MEGLPTECTAQSSVYMWDQKLTPGRGTKCPAAYFSRDRATYTGVDFVKNIGGGKMW